MSTTGLRRSVVLKRRPSGEPPRLTSRSARTPIPHPQPGEVVTRTIWLSIDPYMRGRLREEQTYAVAVQIGEVMTGETIGQVVASADPAFEPGELVSGARGWQTHSVSPGRATGKDPQGQGAVVGLPWRSWDAGRDRLRRGDGNLQAQAR